MAPPHFLHSFPSSVLSTVIVQSPRLLISLFNTLTSGTSNGIVIWALISLPSLSLVALSLFSYPGKACITTICGGLHGSYQRTRNRPPRVCLREDRGQPALRLLLAASFAPGECREYPGSRAARRAGPLRRGGDLLRHALRHSSSRRVATDGHRCQRWGSSHSDPPVPLPRGEKQHIWPESYRRDHRGGYCPLAGPAC